MANHTCGAVLDVAVSGDTENFPLTFPVYFGPTAAMTSSNAAWVADASLEVNATPTAVFTRALVANATQLVAAHFNTVVGNVWTADASLQVRTFDVPFPYTFPFTFDQAPVTMKWGQLFDVGTTATATISGALTRGQNIDAGLPLTTTSLTSIRVVSYSSGTVVDFDPNTGTQTTMGFTGLNGPVGLAIDSAGNTYVANLNVNSILKRTPEGVQTTLSLAGLNNPYGLTIDSHDNLYVANQGSGEIFKVTPGGAQTTYATISGSSGLVFDPDGNLYVSTYANYTVVKVAPDGTQTTMPFTGLNIPDGVAVDSGNSVYVANLSGGNVFKLTPNGTQTTLGLTGLSNPSMLAIDADDNLYVCDEGNNKVYRLTPSGVQTVLGFTGLGNPFGIALTHTTTHTPPNPITVTLTASMIQAFELFFASGLTVSATTTVSMTRNARADANLAVTGLPYRLPEALPFRFWEPATASWGAHAAARLQAVLQTTTAMLWDGSLTAPLTVHATLGATAGLGQAINAALPVIAHFPTSIGQGQGMDAAQDVHVETLGSGGVGFGMLAELPITVITDVTTPDFTTFWPFFNLS